MGDHASPKTPLAPEVTITPDLTNLGMEGIDTTDEVVTEASKEELAADIGLEKSTTIAVE